MIRNNDINSVVIDKKVLNDWNKTNFLSFFFLFSIHSATKDGLQGFWLIKLLYYIRYENRNYNNDIPTTTNKNKRKRNEIAIANILIIMIWKFIYRFLEKSNRLESSFEFESSWIKEKKEHKYS